MCNARWFQIVTLPVGLVATFNVAGNWERYSWRWERELRTHLTRQMSSFASSRPPWAVGSELERLWGSAVAQGIKVDCPELLESEFATHAWIGKNLIICVIFRRDLIS
jgi:hypothetical protein